MLTVRTPDDLDADAVLPVGVHGLDVLSDPHDSGRADICALSVCLIRPASDVLVDRLDQSRHCKRPDVLDVELEVLEPGLDDFGADERAGLVRRDAHLSESAFDYLLRLTSQFFVEVVVAAHGEQGVDRAGVALVGPANRAHDFSLELRDSGRGDFVASRRRMSDDVNDVAEYLEPVLFDIRHDFVLPRTTLDRLLEKEDERARSDVVVDGRGVCRDDVGEVVRPCLFAVSVWRASGDSEPGHHLREVFRPERADHVVDEKDSGVSSGGRNDALEKFLVVEVQFLRGSLDRGASIEVGKQLDHGRLSDAGSVLRVDYPAWTLDSVPVIDGRREENPQKNFRSVVGRREELHQPVEGAVVKRRRNLA